MSRGDRSIQLRAQEIIATSTNPISVKDALKQALLERSRDPEILAEIAAAIGASTLSGLRKRTYDLPEDGDEQGTLFDIPSLIGIATLNGDLLVPKDQANVGHVRQWQKEGRQHHATQLLRFKRAGVDLEALDDLVDETGWIEARTTLGERKRKALEAEA